MRQPRARATSRASIDGRRCARSRLHARGGACPSPTTPSPVVLAEAPTRIPSRAVSSRVSQRTLAAASAKTRCSAKAGRGQLGRTARRLAPRAAPIAPQTRRGPMSKTTYPPATHPPYNTRGVVPSFLEETLR